MLEMSFASALSFGNLASIADSSVATLSLRSTTGARSRALLERITILAIAPVSWTIAAMRLYPSSIESSAMIC